jgi:hypothetical protein
LGENVVRVRASLSWSDFLKGVSGDLPSWTQGEARNSAFRLLNRAWTLHVEKQGVTTGFLANGRPFWFFPDQHFPSNKVQFTNHSGRRIKRQLVGYSGKRRVYWHFGIQARCFLVDQEFSFSLTPHVTFSADGKVLLPSKTQLHSLRRSFCRSWWNDRWRDLLQGFVSALCGEYGSLDLDVGSDMPTRVAKSFGQFRSASSLVEAEALLQLSEEAVFDEEIEDEWEEEFADDGFVEQGSGEPFLPESN